MGFFTKTARFAPRANPPSEWMPQKQVLRFAALGLVLNFLSLTAFALNLGHLQINSKQGEPLKARIEVLSATPEELEGLRVRLYGEKDYEALRLSWESSLANTTLKLIEGQDARLFVQIEGQEPVRESFVELFFEMRWNAGQVNRQIGLLLDPLATPPSLTEGANADNADIMVSPGDSASKLLEPFMNGEVSMDQMLMALLRNNPKSFINGNVNLLLSGSTLKVPSASTAAALKPLEARSQVQRQNEAFESYKKALINKIKSSPNAELKSSQQKASGKVHDPKGNKSRAKDQLTLNAPKGSTPQDLEKLSQEKAAQEQAQKLLELQNNIKELQALREQEKGFALLKLWRTALEGIETKWDQSKEWAYSNAPALKTFTQWNLAPVVSGLLFAILVLFSAWRMQLNRVKSNRSNPEDMRGSSDPKDWRDASEAGFIGPSFEELKDESLNPGSVEGPRMTPTEVDERHNSKHRDGMITSKGLTEQNIHEQVARHASEPILEDDRVKLAEDLWEIGQHHTAYAIAQEVYQQSSGREFERAKMWLESHAI